MIRKLSLLYHTVRHLRLQQIKYQLLYRLKKARPLNAYDTKYDQRRLNKLSFKNIPPVHRSILEDHTFVFLNLAVSYTHQIDWNDQRQGKLWNYNLQYFNYLFQEDIEDSTKLSLLHSFYQSMEREEIALEPYPVSLRAINIIRWYNQYKIHDPALLEKLHAELDFLSERLEYHLLGNHLLENAFALLMGGAFFDRTDWLQQGQYILENELKEQILSDGAHFELSPMYHQIIFFRVLESIDWYSRWKGMSPTFFSFLKQKAGTMRSWLEQISFKNGDIPHFNDSADDIAFPTKWLENYAAELGIITKGSPLGFSGYRSVKKDNYECKVDFAQLGPSYQPGHAHADALSFILYHNNKPFFVERGTSTYENGSVRDAERSTAAHNTVVVGGKNQSEVYGAFRVGNRAVTKIISEDDHRLVASHDGYERAFDLIHTRSFLFENKSLSIKDQLSKPHAAKAYFYLYPDVVVKKLNDSSYLLNENCRISFEGLVNIVPVTYNYAEGFNKTKISTVLEVDFKNELNTSIDFSVT